MGGPIPVILADINMVYVENKVVKPMNLPFYKRFTAERTSFNKMSYLKL